MPKRSNLRLTTRFVKALRTDGKDAFFWDHELAGFGVRVATTHLRDQPRLAGNRAGQESRKAGVLRHHRTSGGPGRLNKSLPAVPGDAVSGLSTV